MLPQYLEHVAAILVIAVAIDLLWGEPPTFVHPVVWMGTLIGLCVSVRPQRGRRRQFCFGLLIAFALPSAVALVTAALLELLAARPVLGLATSIWLLTSSFSIRALGAAAERVRQCLHCNDVASARQAVGHLCSRDTEPLSEEEVAGAAIESVAENVCDSFIAPVFYFLLFGIPGAVAYRCINTLDSRLGYRGAFEYLGKASARLDDVANFIPARISAGLFVVSGALQRARVGHGLVVWRRDRNQTESPNAGQSMAMMAGLLGVRLEKRDCYALGDPIQKTGAASIAQAWDIAFAAMLLWAAVSVGVLLV